MICCARNGPHQKRGGSSMIEMRRTQLSFGDGLIAEEVSDLREGWMSHADTVLADEDIVAAVYEALAKRHPKSRCRGRRGAPADMVLRLLVLKHIRNWSYEVLEREVRANLVYRDFTHVGAAKMPDAKTMGRWGLALGPQVLKQVHERIVTIARDTGVTAGRRMRVDTTVVETDIHHPTDSTLLGDGVRVLTRAMRKITEIAGAVGTKLRDRSRSVKLRLLEIGRGRAPRLVAADAAFYSAKNEAAAKAKGVKRVCIPNRSTRNSERKREQRKRWFRSGQKWRTGCEGRISVVKRRHGLDRCRYKGYVGMERWVGLGVIADNVVNIGPHHGKADRPLSRPGLNLAQRA